VRTGVGVYTHMNRDYEDADGREIKSYYYDGQGYVHCTAIDI